MSLLDDFESFGRQPQMHPQAQQQRRPIGGPAAAAAGAGAGVGSSMGGSRGGPGGPAPGAGMSAPASAAAAGAAAGGGPAAPGEPPMFSLERVEYQPSADIVSLCVASNTLVMGLANNHVIRLNLSAAAQLEDIEVAPPSKGGENVIKQMFLDPSGTHLIIAMSNAESFYLREGQKKARLLAKFRGAQVTAVAWNAANQSAASTGEILVGTSNGRIFMTDIDAGSETRSGVKSLVGGASKDQSEFRLLYTLDDERAVTGLQFEKFPSAPSKALSRYWVLATTPLRVYEFIGGPTLEELFTAHNERAPRFHELPGDLPHCTVQFFYQKDGRGGREPLPKSFAWMTEPGVYYGELDFGAQRIGGSCVPSPQVLNYDLSHPPGRAKPLAIALTEFHYLVLYDDALFAMSVLSQEPVWREIISPSTPFGQVRGLARDLTEGTLWLFTNKVVFEIPVQNEERRVWELYMEQNPPQFELALQYATTPQQKDRVKTSQADYYFENGDYALAAQHYGSSSRSFEEITLKFISLDEQEALKVYLLSKLQTIKRRSSSSSSSSHGGGDATQITLIATWLCEIFLDQLNQIQDELDSAPGVTPTQRARSGVQATDAVKLRASQLKADFEAFLTSYAKNLDKNTTFNLMTSHGRNDSVLFFAKVKGDIDRVMQHLLQHENYAAALEAMSSHAGADGSTDPDLFYRYSPTLMKVLPKETVDAWIAAGDALDPGRLIPALMRYASVKPDDLPVSKDEAVRYLQHCVSRFQNTDAAIHNYLLSLYATRPASEIHSAAASPREVLLLQFLRDEPRYYDMKYALRVCTEQERHRACVQIYNLMNMYEEATDLALLCNDLEEAEAQAMATRDDDYGGLKKKLWLKIARHVIQQRGEIETGMNLLSKCDGLLKIEDILPFFPPFTKIDQFKKEICSSLEDYNLHIQRLKDEMEDATKAAEDIRADISKLKDHYGFVAAGQRCALCNYPVMTQVFYMFPCQHVVHVECQFQRVQPYLDAVQGRRVAELQARLGLSLGEDRNRLRGGDEHAVSAAGIESNFAKKLSSYRSKLGSRATTAAQAAEQGGAKSISAAQQQAAMLDDLREELDDIVAAECTLCGDVMIDETSQPFIHKEHEQSLIRSWSISGDLLY